MVQGLLYGEGVHLAAHAFSGFECIFKKMPGNSDCQRISHGLALGFAIFIPRRQGQRDPYGASINQKLDIYRVCMPGGNGDNQRLINTVDLLLGPAIEGVEVAIHGNKTIPISPEKRQFADHDFAAKKFTG